MARKQVWNWKLTATSIAAIILYLVLICCAVKVGNKESIPVTYLWCIAGSILGWIIGIITTPYDKDDQSRIGSFTKTIGAFVSGYLLSKFDKIFTAVDTKTLLTDLVGSRLLLFFCCFGLMWIIVFVYRSYTTIYPSEEL